MHTHRGVENPAVAIVGGDSLLGKEIHDIVDTSHVPVRVKLISADEEGDTNLIAAGQDEPIVMSSLDVAELGGSKVVILAGSAESGRKAAAKLQELSPSPAVIDLSGALEERPSARLRAPMVEPTTAISSEGIQVIAHPAAIALALFLTRLRRAGAIRISVAEIFEPVSERGQAGIDELQKQTVALLSFKPLPKEVFDTQVSFSLVPEYGSDSRHSLSNVELKIERDLASLLAADGNIPMPSLRVIHAPVFHGYSLSVWVEFEENPGMEAISSALQAGNIDLRTGDLEPPSNIGVAGQGGIAVGAIRQDRNQPRAFWFWIAADNLRISAENAVEVLRELIR